MGKVLLLLFVLAASPISVSSKHPHSKVLKDAPGESLELLGLPTNPPPLPVDPSESGSSKCPADWKFLASTNACYMKTTTESDWNGGSAACAAAHPAAQLASMHSKDEAQWMFDRFVRDGKGDGSWIGLNVDFQRPPTMPGTRLTATLDTINWSWTDASAKDFVWWAPGEPDIIDDIVNNACGQIYVPERPFGDTGRVILWICTTNATSICKIPASP